MIRLLPLKTLTPEVERMLSGCGDPAIWTRVKADIEAGFSQLFACPNHSYIVLRIEGNELIFVAAVGSDAIGMCETALEICRQKGLIGIRFYTARKGLARLLRRFNPAEIQRVYRIPANEN